MASWADWRDSATVEAAVKGAASEREPRWTQCLCFENLLCLETLVTATTRCPIAPVVQSFLWLACRAVMRNLRPA